MYVSVRKADFSGVSADVLGIPLLKGEKLPAGLAQFSACLKKGEFEGTEGQTAAIRTPGKAVGKAKFGRLLLIGLGEEKEVSVDSFRKAAGALVRYAKSSKCGDVALILPQRFSKPEFAQAVAEGAVLSNYKCMKFKSEKGKKEDAETEISEFAVIADAKFSGAVAKGKLLADAQNYAREIGELPANMLPPIKLAEFAKKLARERKLAITVYGSGALKKMKMNGILAVAQGSANPPALVMLEYNRDKKGIPLYCIVGKGVMFDSGGISIKPSKGMHEMKYDKSGAVNCLGIMKAVSELKLPIRLVALLPLVENMPSGSAQKPGDIITAYNGKTIEVLNTDAEGRLILADALAFAAEKKPKAIIDMATLTGAINICFGPLAAGLFSNDDHLANALVRASEKTHERLWRMPIWKEYSEFIKSELADIKNIGSEAGEASPITASKFLQEFVGEAKWAHLDIASVDMVKYPHPYLEKGASGFGVRLVVSALEGML